MRRVVTAGKLFNAHTLGQLARHRQHVGGLVDNNHGIVGVDDARLAQCLRAFEGVGFHVESYEHVGEYGQAF